MAAEPNRPARLRATPSRHVLGAGGALVVLASVSWPLVFSSSTFNTDWANHLWYMWHQSVAIRELHAPSLFLDYSRGIFYPLYAFYGGTLYALAGTLSLALGDAPLQAYIVTYLLGFSAAYGGWYWAARSFGVRGWRAHLPGLVFVTSTSYLTTVYALGDWPEFLALSAMPLIIAAGLSVLRAPRLHLGPALALTAAGVVFFGSHLLTLIWGATILAIFGVALVACVPAARHAVTRAGALRVSALMIPALLLSAWFLLPTAVYESHTFIAHAYPHFRKLLQQTIYTVAARNLFSLSRSPSPGSIVSLSLPVLAIAWVLVSIALLLARRRVDTWTRALLAISLATVAVGVLMTHAGLILAFPRLFATLQFAFRLEGFVLLGVSGAMLAVLVAAAEGPARLRTWTWLLVPIAVVSIVGAIEQTVNHPRATPRATVLDSYLTPPPERFAQFDYLDNRLPVLERPLPAVSFPLQAAASSGRASASVPFAAGQLVSTNLRGGPDLVEVKGARIVGLDAENDDVLEVTGGADPTRAPPGARAAAASATTVAVGPANRAPIVVGRLLSLAGAIALALVLGHTAVRGRRRAITPASPPQ